MNRVAAFDVLTITSVTAIVLIAVFEERALYLDLALVYAPLLLWLPRVPGIC